MICPICGKSRNLIAGVFAGARHPECVKAEAARLRSVTLARERTEADRRREQEMVEADHRREQHEKIIGQIAKGIFKNLNNEAEMMLNEGETCCAVVKGCWSTLFYPRAAGRVLPGQAVRVDGLKKNDWGTLHLTDKRICFVGRGGAKTVPMKKIIQCETHSDVLHVTAEGRASASYFIIESQEVLVLVASCIRKLAALSKAGEKPIFK